MTAEALEHPSIPALAEQAGLYESTVYRRLHRGWPLERALGPTSQRWGGITNVCSQYRTLANRSIIGRLRQLFLWNLGRLCHHDMIIDVLWGDDQNGGPLTIDNNISVYIHRLRNLGWDIQNLHGRGYICHEAGR